MAIKIIALVISAAFLASSVSARTISMEKDSLDMQKTFFHPFFPPIGHGIGFGGGQVPGIGGAPVGFPSGGAGILGGGLGAGFSGAIGTGTDRSGSSNGATLSGGPGSSGAVSDEDNAGAAGSGLP